MGLYDNVIFSGDNDADDLKLLHQISVICGRFKAFD